MHWAATPAQGEHVSSQDPPLGLLRILNRIGGAPGGREGPAGREMTVLYAGDGESRERRRPFTGTRGGGPLEGSARTASGDTVTGEVAFQSELHALTALKP